MLAGSLAGAEEGVAADATSRSPFRLVARNLEPSWPDALVAELLGVHLAAGADVVAPPAPIPSPPPGRAFVTRSRDGTSATVELGCEADLVAALARDGLEVPATHGYRRCRLEHAWVATPEKIYPPGSDPPLETQLAPLPLAEIQRRLAILTPPTARPHSPSAEPFFFDDDVSAPDVSAPSGDRPSGSPANPKPDAIRRRRLAGVERPDVKNKTAAHVLATRRLALLMGGARPVVRRLLGAPLRSTPAGADACDRLLARLRAFGDWPSPTRKRAGVVSGEYLTIKRGEAARWASRERDQRTPDDAASAAFPSKENPRLDLWRSASEVLRAAAPDASFDAVAFTKAFRGSPHVDAKDVAHQHVFALGDFEGGELCYEDGEGETDVGNGVFERNSNGSEAGSTGLGTVRVDVRTPGKPPPSPPSPRVARRPEETRRSRENRRRRRRERSSKRSPRGRREGEPPETPPRRSRRRRNERKKRSAETPRAFATRLRRPRG